MHVSRITKQNKQNDVAEEGGAENGSPQNQFHHEPTANLIQNPSGGEVADEVATLSEEGIQISRKDKIEIFKFRKHSLTFPDEKSLKVEFICKTQKNQPITLSPAALLPSCKRV